MAENKNREVFPNENLNQGKSSGRDDQSHNSNNQKNKEGKSNNRETRDNTSSQGYGSSQRRDQENVGPLEADLNELPSKRRTSKNNQTGSGLG